VAEVSGGAVLADAVDAAEGGLPLVPSLETAARSIDSRQVAAAVLRSVETVREGKGLSVSMASTKVFPELAVEMTEVGSRPGRCRRC